MRLFARRQAAVDCSDVGRGEVWEGGGGGGTIIAEGPPNVIAATAASYTGRYLKPVLEAEEKRRGKAKEAAPRDARGRKVSGDLLG